MLLYFVRRLLYAIIVIFGVTSFVFGLMRLSGDPALLLLPSDASPQAINTLRHELGLDQPLWVQYAKYLDRALHGDFGTSFRTGQPAMSMVLQRVPATLELAVVALFLTLVISLPSGVIAATHRNSFLDFGGRGIAILGQAIPSFWLGIMLILLFSVKLRWLPPFGAGGIKHLILPGITLGAYSAAIISRLLRSSTLEALASDYIRTARAKGVTESGIVFRHALRNASLPVVTVVGLQTGVLFGGAVITEYVFSYPGMGLLVLDAIANRDFAVVQAFVILLTFIIVAANLAVDLLYALLDPRVKYR